MRSLTSDLHGRDHEILTCPECRERVLAADWNDTEVPCEDCGDHPAIICPMCGYRFDMIYHDMADFQPYTPPTAHEQIEG